MRVLSHPQIIFVLDMGDVFCITHYIIFGDFGRDGLTSASRVSCHYLEEPGLTEGIHIHTSLPCSFCRSLRSADSIQYDPIPSGGKQYSKSRHFIDITPDSFPRTDRIRPPRTRSELTVLSFSHNGTRKTGF